MSTLPGPGKGELIHNGMLLAPPPLHALLEPVLRRTQGLLAS